MPLGYQPSVPDSNSQKKNSSLDELNKLSQAEISTEASRIMGSHNSLESLSQSKFNQHMRDAEEHLKAGRYYRAAGCFSMASVYQADNPLALAGRGHALLAAGEYVSSALFLSRALAISPEYLQMRVDLVAMLGDEGKLAVRIADIEQWLARSGSSQLQFLLGYVYYRTGQFLRAKQAIDAAYDKTPQSPAVQAMKITLDNI
jgi:tetratricopeptide (TPR) repeat protein